MALLSGLPAVGGALEVWDGCSLRILLVSSGLVVIDLHLFINFYYFLFFSPEGSNTIQLCRVDDS